MTTRTRPDVPSSEAVAAHYEQSAKRRRSGRKLIWGIMVGMALLILLTPVVLYVAWQARGRALLRERIAAIQAEGEPITTKELAAHYALPQDVRDITAIWAAAIAPFESPAYTASAAALPIVGSGTEPPALDQPLPADDKAAIRAFLLQHKELYAALYAAANEEGEVRYSRQFSKGIGMLLPEAQQVRAAVRGLDLEFEILAREDDPTAAIENIAARIKAGETLRKEPLLISMLVRIAVHSISFQDVRQLAATGKLNDEQLAHLQQLIRNIDIHGQMREAMLGERAWCYHAFHMQQAGLVPNVNSLNGPVEPIDFETTEDPSGVRRPEDCAMALDFLGRMQDAAQMPLPEMLDRLEDSEREIQALAGGDHLSKLRYMLTLMLLPAVSSVGVADARGTANRDVTDVALAIERYKLKQGKLPQAIEELVPNYLPQVPQDPYDGQPVRFRASAEKVVVYSIGKDKVDDGGLTNGNSMEPDIAVEVKGSVEK